MQKKLIDFKLLRELLRQSKFLGIVTMLFPSVFIIGVALSEVRFVKQFQATDLNSDYFSFLLYDEILWLFVAFLFLVIPLMTLMVYRFQNTRHGSDFYHALPNTRTSLHITSYCSVLFWVTAALVLGVLSALLINATCSSYLLINIPSIFQTSFTIWSASILLLSCFALGTSLTGTFVSNILVSLSLLFLPRILITTALSSLSNNLLFVPQSEFLPILDSSYHIPFHFLSSLFSYQIPADLTFLPGGFYTLAIGILFFGISIFAANKRHSETSGTAAVHPVVQSTFRICVSFLVCLIPCYFLLQNLFFNRYHAETVASVGIGLTIVLFVLGILVYFLYELITTRKWKNLLHVFPGLGVLILINILFVGGLTLSQHRLMNTLPKAEEITSIKLIKQLENDEYSTNQVSYSDLLIANLEYKDKELNKLIANALEDTLDYSRRFTRYSNDPALRNVTKQEVEITTGKKTMRREIWISEEDFTQYLSILSENPDFQKAYAELPEYDSKTMYSWDREIYELFRKEVQELDFNAWYDFYQRSSNYAYFSIPEDEDDTFFLLSSVYLSGIYNGKRYSSSYPLSIITPKATTLAVLKENKQSHPSGEEKQMMLSNFEKGDKNTHLYMDFYQLEGEGFSFNLTTENLSKEESYNLVKYCLEQPTDTFDITKPLARVGVNFEEGDTVTGWNFIINIDPELFEPYYKKPAKTKDSKMIVSDPYFY